MNKLNPAMLSALKYVLTPEDTTMPPSDLDDTGLPFCRRTVGKFKAVFWLAMAVLLSVLLDTL